MTGSTLRCFPAFLWVRKGNAFSRIPPSPRVADAFALNATVVFAVATLGVSLMLLVVSVASFARLRTAKLLIVGGAFALLAVKGALWSYRGIVLREADVWGSLLDFAVMGFLYASVAKR